MIQSLCVRCGRNTFFVPIILVMTLPLLCSCSGYQSTLSPRISVGEQYTDNVAASSIPKSAGISTVTPGMTYSMTGPTSSLSLSADPSFVYFEESGGGSFGTEQLATLNAADQFAVHSGLTLTDTFNRSDIPNPVLEPVFVRSNLPTPPIDFTIRTSTQPYTANFANFGFRQDLGPDDYFLLNYTSTLLNNDDPAYQNNTANTPAANLRYWLSPEYGIDLATHYTMGDFSTVQGSIYPSIIDETYFALRGMRRFSPTFDLFVQGTDNSVNEGTVPGFNTYDATAGVDYHLSPSVFFTLSGGYFFYNEDSGKQTSFPEAHADMAKQFEHASVRLTGDLGGDEAFFGAQNLGFDKYYSGSLAGSYSFTEHISGIASVGYRNDNYLDINVTQSGATFLAGINYQVESWMLLALRYTHNTADSTLVGVSYNENRVGLLMTLTPRTPYLLGR